MKTEKKLPKTILFTKMFWSRFAAEDKVICYGAVIDVETFCI